MVVPSSRRSAPRVSPGVAAGAAAGAAIVLWPRAAGGALSGAVVSLAALGLARLVLDPSSAVGEPDVELALALVLGASGAVAGLVTWAIRARRPEWRGRRFSPAFALGGLILGGLVPFALVGVSPGGGLGAAFAGCALGLVWSLARRTPDSTTGRRIRRPKYEPAAQDEVSDLLHRVGLDDHGPGGRPPSRRGPGARGRTR